MIKRLYTWFHKAVAKDEEKDQPSGGVWPHVVRKGVLNICQATQGAVMEVGCGEGLFIRQLALNNPGLKITGVDNNSVKLEEAKRKCHELGLVNVNIIFADAANIPVSAECFNCVVCINVLLNLPSIEVVRSIIKEISRVCACGGKFVFDFRNSANPVVNLKYRLAPYYDETVKRDSLPLNTYSSKQITALLSENKFKVISRKYLGFPYNRLAPIIIIEAEKC
ncbi:MAG: class I SAM-dependent methyltransferase [Candidatus Omnitrophota bacterium]